MRLVIVDDCVETGEAMVQAMTVMGHDAKAVRTVEEGGLLLAAGGVDAAIVDWWLAPDGDGLRLVEDARAAGIATPCVLLTGMPDVGVPAAEARRVQALPGVVLLHKPIDPEALVAAIEALRGVHA